MNPSIIILLIASTILSACSTSSATFRSGIRFEGDNARQDRHGLYQLDLQKSYGISLIGNCAEVVHKGTMTFPIIPMPPLLPTGNKVKKDAAQRPFKLILQSNHGLRVNHQSVVINLALNGEQQQLQFSEATIDKKRGHKQFTYSTNYTCEQIKNASISVDKLIVSGSTLDIPKHSMNFFEETKWSNN